MIKSKLDFKLINIALIAVICYFVYESSGLWLNILNKVISIIIPLFLGFTIAYAFYPVLNYLKKYKIPKLFGIFLVFVLVFLIFITIILLLIPIISNQGISLINSLIIFITNVTTKFDIDFLNNIIAELGLYISNGVFKTINVVSNFVISLFSSVYFLLDMDKIRNYLKKYLVKKSNNLYLYFKMLDLELQKYISGFFKIIFISFFEYTFFYYIIGHPNSLLLGILAALSNFIPYFGGIVVQIVAVMTGLVISQSLGLKITILTLLLGLFDSYILNPLVYGKSNQLHPLVIIFSVFIGGILFGFIGVLISIPISIIIINSFKFYKEIKK